MVTVNLMLGRDKFLERVRRNSEYYTAFLRTHEHNHVAIKEEYENILAALVWSFRIKNWQAVIDGVCLLFRYWREQGHWNDGIRYLRMAFEASLQLGDFSAQAQITRNLGNLFWIQGDLPQALDAYYTSLTCSQKAGDASAMARVYGNLGVIHQIMGETQKALDFHQKSLAISEPSREDVISANQYDNLGRLYTDAGEWQKARRYLRKSLPIRTHLKDTHGIGRVYINLAIIDLYLCAWRQALTRFEKARKIFIKLQDRHMLAMIYEDMGVLYHRSGQTQEDWQRARSLLQEAILLYKDLGNATYGLARTYFALGKLYLDIGEWERALACYEDTLSLVEKEGPTSKIAVEPQLRMARVYLELRKWEKALVLYEEARGWLEHIEDRLVLIELYSDLSETFLGLANPEDALRYAQMCFEQTKRASNTDEPGMALAYGALAKVYYSAGDQATAVHFFTDSLNLYHKHGLRYNVGRTYYEMGLCDALWDKETTRSYLAKARDIFERLGAKIALEKAKQALASQ